ncbi:MAG: LamG domain-containing protein, partial [Bacteroidota bacterium]
MRKIILLLFISILFVGQGFAQDHHWPLTADANDVVGTLHGTNHGVTFATDAERGDVAVFDGSGGDSFIYIPSLLNGQDEATISLWVKQNVGSTWSRIYSFGVASDIETNQNHGCDIHFTLVGNNPNDDTRFEFLNKNYADPCHWNAWPGKPGAITIGEWHHSVVTLTRTKVVMYLDGEKIAEQNLLSDPFTMDDQGNVLGRAYWPDADVQAAMSDFRVYNNALSDTEVAALYVETEQSTAEIAGGFSIKDITASSATATAVLNQDGTVHVISLAAGSPAPTIEEVKASTAVFTLTA